MAILTKSPIRFRARERHPFRSASGNAYGKSTLDTTIVPRFRRNEKDTGSPEAQIALWTCRIKQLSDHLSENRKDYQCARGLQIILGKRRKMLEYLYKHDKYVPPPRASTWLRGLVRASPWALTWARPAPHHHHTGRDKYVNICTELDIRQTIKITPRPR